MEAQNTKVVKRSVKGPCIFCRRENVPFSPEHLPAITIAGEQAIELVDWVCSDCNNRFSVEDTFFASHYHGATGRVAYGVIGRNRKGAEVHRKDVWGRFDPSINTVQIRIKSGNRKENMLAAFDRLDKREPTNIQLDNRVVDTRRLGKCLAKMALETVSRFAPETVLDAQFDPIREYAQGRGPLRLLPFALALGNPTGKIYVNLCDIKFDDSDKRVMISLIYLPACVYAIQLSDYDDLHPLWHVAKLFNMIFDEDGKRTQKLILNFNLEFDAPQDLNPPISGQ